MKILHDLGKEVMRAQPETIADLRLIFEEFDDLTLKTWLNSVDGRAATYIQAGDDADGYHIGDGDHIGPVWATVDNHTVDIWFCVAWQEDSLGKPKYVYLGLECIHIDAVENPTYDDHKRTERGVTWSFDMGHLPLKNDELPILKSML